jgi:hypothetical protein
MKRSEALAVLHEILKVCQETITMHSISLDLNRDLLIEAAKGLEIRIKCKLDGRSRERIKDILEKYGLDMKEDEEFITFYSKTQYCSIPNS